MSDRQYVTDGVLLPPYGSLTIGYSKSVRTTPFVPPDWKEPEGCDDPCREAAWDRWKNATLKIIAEALWPVYDPLRHTWVGESAASMNLLTETDLALLGEIRTQPGVLPLDTVPNSPARALNCPVHRKFFLTEDDDKQPFLAMYAFYDRSLDDKTTKALIDLCTSGLTNKSWTVSLQFKVHFQRPRPYQTALLFGFDKITFHMAATSMTPSLSSGHCLEGVLGTGAVMEEILLSGTKFSEDSWAALEQHAVDIGDRRVMAGVHYPSDNIASWIIAMRMADKVYRSPEVKKRLWNAIHKRSFVYDRIRRRAETGNGRVYRRALQALIHAAA